MFDRILVTLDGSEFSEAILGPAGDLCRMTNARVTLLRVVDIPNDTAASPGVYPAAEGAAGVATQVRETIDQKIARVEDEVQTYLKQKARALRGSGEGVETEVLFSDKVADSIVEYAKGMDADLIMMSTHGRSGLASLMPGSVAQKVMRATRRPVLLVCPADSE